VTYGVSFSAKSKTTDQTFFKLGIRCAVISKLLSQNYVRART